MKTEDIRKAFCGQIDVREVPAGYAVKTPFSFSDGDLVGFYVTRQAEGFRLEDSGLLVPLLESTGVNLHQGSRAEQFLALLKEHGAEFDEDSQEIHSPVAREDDVPAAAVRFVALLLRLQDLQLMRPEIVEKTFVDDAKKAIYDRFGSVASVEFDASPNGLDGEYTADVLIVPPEGKKLALYLGTRDPRVDEAVMLWIEGQWKKAPYQVAVLYENEKRAVSQKTYRRALNRLDSTLIFRGDETGALDKIGRMISIESAATATKH